MAHLYKLHNKDSVPAVQELPSKGFAIVTDTPYGINYIPSFKKYDGSKNTFDKIVGDDKPFDPSHLLRFDYVALFGSNFYSDKLPVGTTAIWDKRTKESLDKMLGLPCEIAWVKSDEPDIWIFRVLHGGVINADSINGNNEPRYHPTQKPVTLFKRLILKMKIPLDVVIVDPYMGAGSCGIASIELGYSFIGYEIVKKYFAIAEKRISQAAQQPALFHATQQSVNPTRADVAPKFDNFE
jgi:site-specific DNA-methyltransferase (adenine-specific)